MHVCPMVTGIVPHVGGPILPPGCTTVLIGGLPAARVTDMATCVGPPDVIAMGSPTVLIGYLIAARMGDPTVHGGVIVEGCPTVMIGVPAQGFPPGTPESGPANPPTNPAQDAADALENAAQAVANAINTLTSAAKDATALVSIGPNCTCLASAAGDSPKEN